MTHLLELDGLQTRIRLRSGTIHAVDGLSLELDAGETLGIVGESGCGKTMAAMSIMRLLPRGGYIAGGEIRLDGRDLVKLPDAELRKVRGGEIGMVFQDPMTSLNPTMTIGKQIAEVVLAHRDVSRNKAMERAVEVLDMVGLPRPGSESGLPAPAVGRPAPARDDRHGARLQPEAADRRRADHRAGRDDPGPDPGRARPDKA